MTKQQGIGTYLAQGWSANAILNYLLMLGVMLFNPGRDDWAGLLIVIPIYFSMMGVVGGAVGMLIWIIECVTGRRTSLLYRGAGAILFPVLLSTILAATMSMDWVWWLWFTTPLVALVLPPALLAGSPLNPLRFVVMGLGHDLPKYGWSRALSIVVLPLLRLTSALGILESLLYLTTLRSREVLGWNTADIAFAGAVFAVVYFWVTLIVSLVLPEKLIVVLTGIILNVPIAWFALGVQRQSNFDYQLLIAVCVLVPLWTLFIVSQCVRSETRLVPVTMLEIRLRHAFNYW
jgi:hypothetical protein